MNKPMKHGLRLLSIVLTVVLIIGLASPQVSAQDADTIITVPAPDSLFVYGYNGQQQSPSGSLASIGVGLPGSEKTVNIHKYQLENTTPLSDEAIWTYCSDFAVAPRVYDGATESLLYKRTDIESVNHESNFFQIAPAKAAADLRLNGLSFEDITAKLRAILLNSDLAAANIGELQQIIPNLTTSDAIAGAQIAIWYLVNSEVTLYNVNRFAPSGSAVRAYFDYLMGLDGVKPEDMSNIVIKEYSKELDESSVEDLYKVTIGYYVDGATVTEENRPKLNEIEIAARYTELGEDPVEITALTPTDKGDYYTVTISGIPRGAGLEVNFRGIQKNVNTVYLFMPYGGRYASQTLISVVKGSVPLETTLKLVAPGDPIGLTVFKDWMYNGTTLIPNNVAKDYESKFKITYADGDFKDAIISDFSITGNGSAKTPRIFEKDKNYKIEEFMADREAVSIIKYFTVKESPVSGGLEIVWTNQAGDPLAVQLDAERFINSKSATPGDVKIQKTLAGGIGKSNDDFTFEVSYKASSSGTARLYDAEPYELYDSNNQRITDGEPYKTDASGRFTLKGGQYAIFKNLPPNSQLIVDEIGPSDGDARYHLDPAIKTATLTTDGVMQALSFTNTYKTGSLIINKTFASGSALGWGAFEDGINFTVTGADGFSQLVTLTATEPSKTLYNLPIGSYTVTEDAEADGYELIVTGTGRDGMIAEGSISTANFENSYRKRLGDLTITKAVMEGSGAASNPAITGKTFTFSITGPNGYTNKIELSASLGWSTTISNLVPGNYTVTELTSGKNLAGQDIDLSVENLNLDVTVNDSPGESATLKLDDEKTITFNFVNNYMPKSGSLTVTKNISGALTRSDFGQDSFSFTITGPSYPTTPLTITLPDSEDNWSKTIGSLIPGFYTVTENQAGAAVQNYSLSVSDGGVASKEVRDRETASVGFTNTYTRQKGGLSFQKIVTNKATYYNDESFTFTVTRNNVAYNGYYTLNDSTTPIQTPVGGVISIKADDTVHITGLNAGDVMVITETASGSFTLTGVTVSGGTGTTDLAAENGTTTIVNGGDPLFTFTNAKNMGSFKLTKSVTGLSDSQKAAMSYSFSISGPKGYSGPATVTLLSGATYDFGSQPYGNYTITETNKDGTAKVANYTLAVTGEGTKTLNAATLNVTVTNAYTRDTGKLIVKKTVANAAGLTSFDTNREFNFTVTFAPALTEAVTMQIGTNPSVAIPRGTTTYDFKLKHNQTATFSGIPTNTAYAVSEAADSNYTTAWNNTPSGTITAKGQSASFTCTNTRKTGSLNITKNLKIVGGSLLRDCTVTLRLTHSVTGEVYTITVNVVNGVGIISNKAVPAGTYTVSETVTTIDGYELKDFVLDGIIGKQITITAGGTHSLTVNNNYARETGTLTVTKGFATGSAFNWTNLPSGVTGFTITIAGPSDWVLGAGYSAFNPAGSAGTYSFTLTSANPKLTLSDIPVGSYNITEVRTGIDGSTVTGYTLTVSNEGTKILTSAHTPSASLNIIITNNYTRDLGDLKISKTVVDPAGIDVAKEFSFNVTFTPALTKAAMMTIGADAPVIIPAGIASHSFKLKHGQTASFSGIPTDTVYAVTETKDADYDAPSWSSAPSGTIAKGVAASFTCTNTRSTAGLEVSKIVSGQYDGEDFTFTLTVDGKPWAKKSYTVDSDPKETSETGTFALKDGDTAIFANLPLGAAYVVTETPSNLYDVTPSSAAVNGTVAASGNTAAFTNTRRLVGLKVEKLLDGDAKAGFASTTFSFILSRKIGDEWTPMKNLTVAANTTATGSDGSFTITGAASVTFTNLPAGEYKVEEIALAAGTVPPNISFVKAGDVTGTLTDTAEAATFSFTNKFTFKIGELKVTKSSNWSDNTKQYTLTLYKQDGDDWIEMSDLTVAANTTATGTDGEFILKQGDTAHFTNLKNGFYKVVETPAGESSYGWSVTYKVGTADVPETGVEVKESADAPLITVTNTYTRETGGLSVTKQLAGIASSDTSFDRNKDFHFVLYSGGAGSATPFAGTYSIGGGEPKPADGGMFSLKDGQTATFTGLPTGVYTVVETDAGVPGYELIVTGDGIQTASVEDATTAPLTFTNTYNRIPGDLTVAKVVTGYPSTDWEFSFTIKGPDDWKPTDLGSANSDGSYNFKLNQANTSKAFLSLPGGEYTITETSPTTPDDYGVSTTVKVNGSASANPTSLIVGGTNGDPTVEFTNAYTRDTGKLTLSKSLIGIDANKFGADAFSFELTGPDGGVTPITLGSGAWSKQLDKLPTGVYTLKEIPPAPVAGFSYLDLSYEVDGEEEPDDDGLITFTVKKGTEIVISCTNIYNPDLGIIRVTKVADGFASSNDRFEFQITPKANYSYSIEGSDLVLETGTEGKFSLNAGQTAIFEGRDTEIDYTVTELSHPNFTLTGMAYATGTRVKNEQNEFIWNYNPEVTVAPSDTLKSMTQTMPRKLEGSNPVLSFTFTNQRHTGDLEVSKTLVGENLFVEEFVITVTFNDSQFKPGECKGVVISDNGAASGSSILFTLSGGDSGSVTGLPTGLGYTVSEDPGDGFYIIGIDDSTGTVTDGKLSTHEVTNTRKVGGVKVSKYVYGDFEEDEMFSIKMVFTAPNKADWKDDAFERFFTFSKSDQIEGTPEIAGTKATVTFWLTHDDVMEITNIPVGTTYTVEEILTPDQQKVYSKKIDHYDGMVNPAVSDESGKYEADLDSIKIWNYNIPFDSFIVTKTVSATPGSDLYTKKFDFTLSLYQPDEDDTSGWTSFDFARQTQKAEDLYLRFSQEYAEVIAEIARLKEENSGYLTAYDQAVEKLDDAQTDYDTAKQEIDDQIRNDPDVQALALAARDGAYVDCGICGGSGYDDCGDCGGSGTVSCDECDGTVEDCPKCGGSYEIGCDTCGETGDGDECQECAGSGEEFDPDLADELEEAVFQNAIDEAMKDPEAALRLAEAEFDNDPAVGIYNLLEGLNAQEQELSGKMADMLNAIALLAGGTYLTIDDQGVITQYPETLVPLVPDDSRFEVSAWTLDEESNQIYIDDLDEIDFKDNGDGTYSFTLKHGQYVKFDGLPVGANYKIEETKPDDVGSETFEGCEINGTPGLISPTGKVSNGENSGKLYSFLNNFTLLEGKLEVIKAWPSGSGSITTITVWLTENGERTDRFVILDAENNWTDEFTGLEVGTRILYGISEDVPRGYNASYTAGVYLTYSKPEGTVTVTNSPPRDEDDDDDDDDDDIPPPPTVIIVDGEVPQAGLEPEVVIVDEDVPLGDLPFTGVSPISALAGILGTALAFIGLLLGRRKRTI